MDQQTKPAAGAALPNRMWKLGWMAGAALLSAGLIALSFEWRRQAGALSLPFPLFPEQSATNAAESPLASLLKLLCAAAIGIVITAIQKQVSTAKESRRAMEQAQVLLSVAGALTVLLIGDSLARALGVAGGAAIIRFRTPVDNPKDATVLYLLMGLGMATGLGYFAVAGLGTLFLAVMLLVLGDAKQRKSQKAFIDVVAGGPEFPTESVEAALSRHVKSYRVCRISRGSRASVRYQVSAAEADAIGKLNLDLMSGASGLYSVAWQSAKKEI